MFKDKVFGFQVEIKIKLSKKEKKKLTSCKFDLLNFASRLDNQYARYCIRLLILARQVNFVN